MANFPDGSPDVDRAVRVDAEKNLLILRGSVPGSGGTFVTIRKAGNRPKS